MNPGSHSQLALIFLLSFCLLMNLGCKKAVESFSELYALRAELIRQYKEQDINVVIQNANVLGITFVNSSFNKLGDLEREIKAHEIALFVKDRLRPVNTIDTIWVAFVVSSSFVVFHFSNNISTHVFETKDLKPADPGNTAKGQGEAVASYLQETNETSVYLKKSLQLHHSAGNNVMLLPHFVIPANGVAAPRLAVPDSVVLEFTASSDRRMFQDNTQLIIHVDGRKVFSGKAKLTNVIGSNEEKSVNEFLSQSISYSQFLQLANGKKGRIDLGAKQFELTTEQLRALQDMQKCVEGPNCW